MEGKIAEIRAKLIEFIKSLHYDMELQATPGIVKEVDTDARKCEVEPANGGPMVTALLQPIKSKEIGLVQIPKVDSQVIVDWLDDDHATVVLCSEIDQLLLDCEEVVINGGDKGGLVIAENTANRLNALENDINQLKNILSGWSPVSQDGGAALKTALTAAGYPTDTLTQTQDSDLENDKVKH